MEFFKQVDLDWMGKAKYFFGLSFCLLAVGTVSWIAHGGLYYGIDFKGGTVVDVRFADGFDELLRVLSIERLFF